MPKRLKFVVEQWVLLMVRWQAWRFKIFESARHFRIESGRPIRIRIKSRSFAGPYYEEQINKVQKLTLTISFFKRNISCHSCIKQTDIDY